MSSISRPFLVEWNLTERLCCWKKDWIVETCGLDDEPSYDKLRCYVMEAWDTFFGSSY